MKHKTIDPGPGYRLLEHGEAIQESDECWLPLSEKWVPTSLPGCEVGGPGAQCLYRRKVEHTACDHNFTHHHLVVGSFCQHCGLSEAEFLSPPLEYQGGNGEWSELPLAHSLKASDTQVGGGHYKDFAIQPVEFITKNGLGFCEGNVIKYVCRHREKGGAEDLDKAIHYLQLLKETAYP